MTICFVSAKIKVTQRKGEVVQVHNVFVSIVSHKSIIVKSIPDLFYGAVFSDSVGTVEQVINALAEQTEEYRKLSYSYTYQLIYR